MNRKTTLIAIATLCVGLALASCQTTEPSTPVASASPVPSPSPSVAPEPSPSPSPSPVPVALVAPAASQIKTESAGFAPAAEAGHNTITFDLAFGNPEAIKTWKVEMKSAQGVQKTFMGIGQNLLKSIVWDGKADSGQLAKEGIFTANLSIEYRDTYLPGTAKSRNFALDIQAPKGSITLSQSPFSPIEFAESLTITLNGSSNTTSIDSWSMNIYDPAGNLFKSFAGKWTDRKIVWDGKGISGDLMESAEEYPVELTLRDGFGNIGVVKSKIPVDILVEKVGNGYRILSSRIFFKAYTADYGDVAQELSDQNKTRLDDLARKLKKFPGYKIRLVGHAVMENWEDPVRGKIEQETELIPLSIARAEAVMKAMVERGLPADMMSATGVGAADQLVPDSDMVNHWRNRRVAFFLDKP